MDQALSDDLERVNWSAYGGEARETPRYLRMLFDGTVTKQRAATKELSRLLCDMALMLHPAAAPALPFLVAALTSVDTAVVADLLDIFLNIATISRSKARGHQAGFLDLTGTRYALSWSASDGITRPEPPIYPQMRDLLVLAVPTIALFLRHPERLVFEQALATLQDMVDNPGATAPWILQALEHETKVERRRALAVSEVLALSGHRKRLIALCQQEADLIVRLALGVQIAFSGIAECPAWVADLLGYGVLDASARNVRRPYAAITTPHEGFWPEVGLALALCRPALAERVIATWFEDIRRNVPDSYRFGFLFCLIWHMAPAPKAAAVQRAAARIQPWLHDTYSRNHMREALEHSLIPEDLKRLDAGSASEA